MSHQRGTAVIMAMLIVAAVAALVSGAMWQQNALIRQTENELQYGQARWLMRGAIDWAGVILREDARTSSVDHPGEPWAVPLADTRLNENDGRPPAYMRRAQVFIESLIVEVTSDQAAEFGIQWQGGLGHLGSSSDATAVFGGTNFGTTGQNILGIAQNPATVGTGLNIGVARGTITLPGIGTVTNLQFLARALETKNNANILSTPNILTLDNEEARIVVGQNVPFVTGQFVTPASAGAATVNPFQTVERRDVGITLRVRPQISESGTIKMVIYQEVSSVQEPVSPTGIITNMRAIETNVLVDDGAIVVLGGLVQDNVTNSTEKVPVLGDIPLIGGLFRFETRRQQKTNLMVFLRPFIVRDDADMRGVTSDRYERMRILEQTTRTKPSPVLPNFEPPALPPQVQP